ncbi:MAG: LicD family protein [Bacillota bacterium]
MSRVHITEPDLKKLQGIQLELLQEVDRVCKQNNIKYCIIAGTLLGAVRHGGYIPWDDDADVAMLREEYDKFVLACQRDLNHDLAYFQDIDTTDGYRWGYGKIRRKNTTFLRLGQEHLTFEQGVFIDIFPLDYVPEKKIPRYFHNLHCTLVRKWMWSEVGRYTEKNPIKRMAYQLMARTPKTEVQRKYNALKEKSNRVPTSRVRILTFPTPNNGQYCYFKKWYTDLAEIVFEGVSFPAAKDFDEYLSFKFGDYMMLPPESERKVHPVSAYDFSVFDD